MQIISLLSDWQTSSIYQAWAKAALYKELESVALIDLGHHLDNFDLQHGAYLLNISFDKFAAGTVHINYIESDTRDKLIYIAKAKGQYIVSANNGFVSMLEHLEQTWKVEPNKANYNYIEIAASLAQKIAARTKIEQFAQPANDHLNLNEKYDKPSLSGNALTGHVMYIDGFGNLHTNISKAYFDKNVGVKNFTLYLRKHDTHNTLQTHYSDRPETEIVVFFNSSDYMEIALNKQNASGLLGMNLGMKVIIEF